MGNLSSEDLERISKIIHIARDHEIGFPCLNGEKWLFRTVTHIITGEVIDQRGKFVVLKNAAWIADTGRYMNALMDPDKFEEVEPYPQTCVINTDSLIDSTQIHKLPIKQK